MGDGKRGRGRVIWDGRPADGNEHGMRKRGREMVWRMRDEPTCVVGYAEDDGRWETSARHRIWDGGKRMWEFDEG